MRLSSKASHARSYADGGSHEPVPQLVFLTLTQQEDGTWAVANAGGTDRYEDRGCARAGACVRG